jgi:metal-sulfur cluster biosynthetic enzyme
MSDSSSTPENEINPTAETPAAAENAAEPLKTLCEDSVREQLKQVIDPELYVNIVDLGLIYVVDLKDNEADSSKKDVHVEMTMTSPMCPAGPQLVANSRQVVEAMDGVAEVDIKVVMDPPWTQDMMTEDARDQLGIF